MPGIVIFGVAGRMGQALVRALREGGGLSLCGAVASRHSPRLGLDAAVDGAPTGVLVTAEPRDALKAAVVAVDFSVPACVAANARACVEARVPLLVGVTGFEAPARATLEAAAREIPLLIAPNTSVGVAVLARLVDMATRALGTGYDVEIREAHHRMKRDAPSGTALALGDTVARARGQRLEDVAVFERHGLGEPRAEGAIGFAVERAADIIGEHTVTFAAAGERLELCHRATDRLTFARGALRAAAWLRRRPPGLYSMQDALGSDQP
jgi:4-hydroxy-tetrahydrodipicolinate reductase